MLTSLKDGAADDLLGLSGSVAGELSASLNGVNDVHAFTDGTEHGVVAVEPRRGNRGEEELGATGVSTSVGHGEDTGLVVLEGKSRGLAGNLPARASGTGSSGHRVFGVGAAALDHEIFNHAVEMQTVVMTHFHQFDEIRHGIGGASVKEFDGDVACACFHEDLHGPTTERHLKRICLPWGEAHVHN